MGQRRPAGGAALLRPGELPAQPGGVGDPGGTYFATTVLRWVKLLGGEPGLVERAGFVPLFNGKDLTGWEGDTSLWSARDGMIVGTSPGLKHNDFLATEYCCVAPDRLIGNAMVPATNVDDILHD